MDPGIIKKLDEVVVNRIAAGEIIQRPANALKEMIENSLDAKSSYIQVTVKIGGMKMLQIQDNGTGIRKDDLGIVCERFTTSKLEKFEDLSTISTFGFRGEALASISHVARLSIQTKTAQEMCAYKALYEDGKLVGAPKPCAGNQGTIITVEDLFYNVPQRKQVLKSPNEEFQRISDVVSKYSVHNSHVGFVLKKFGENQTIRTSPNSTHADNIRIIYGKKIADELINISLKDDVHQFSISGCITNANYSAKKGMMLLFINHRLVESIALKTAIDSVYSTHLPKGSYPFIYMSLELEPTIVDVNVHPTKHEVHFLHEDEIIDKIKSYVEKKLLGSNSTRTYYKQTRLPGEFDETKVKQDQSSPSSVTRVSQKELIRTDAKEQKLDKFFNASNDVKLILHSMNESLLASKMDKSFIMKRKPTKLTSILNMRKKIENACSSQLRSILKEMTFVGVVNKMYAIFQQETKLFLCNTKILSENLFYQLLLYNFQNFKVITFDPPLNLRELAAIALDSKESGWCEEDGPKEELVDRIIEILMDKSPIMKEYFGIKISEDGNLETLPLLLDNHKPPICRLPNYILRLSTEVEWEVEEECFQTFCQETANFYSYISIVEEGSDKHKWIVEHVIYPAFKQCLIPDTKLKSCFVELTNLPTMYKVFERC